MAAVRMHHVRGASRPIGDAERPYAPSMSNPGTKRGPSAGAATASDGPDVRDLDAWDRTVGVRLFLSGSCTSRLDELPALVDVVDVFSLPGHVLQAARALAGLSQQDLRDASRVSKKVINDFENGFVRPRPALVEKLATALRDRGARFVRGEGAVGVVVVLTRARVEANSRSPARNEARGSPEKAGRPRARATRVRDPAPDRPVAGAREDDRT